MRLTSACGVAECKSWPSPSLATHSSIQILGFNPTSPAITSHMASILPALRQAAPRLTRQLFQCSRHHCPVSLGIRPRLTQKAPFPSTYARSFRSSPSHASPTIANDVGVGTRDSSPLSSLSKSILAKSTGAKIRFFPKTSEKIVAYWLLGSAASVFGIVVFGGLTRLTESGWVVALSRCTLAAKSSQVEHHRMETSHWLSASYQQRRLDLGIQQIPGFA